jgi:ubiquinone/menaquinone biosynthesis C-methylase UbiE
MFADPVKILKQFGIMHDMVVADLGAGSGFYSIPAGRLASHGKVYAIEIQKDFLTTLRINANHSHVLNVECLWGDVESIGGTKLADGIVDRVIASNILFQTKDKYKFRDECNRILKKGGKLLLVDWSDTVGSLGPKNEQIISKEKALNLFEQKGFIFEKEIEAGEHHYGMIFIKE